jgi:hypothetical protein
MSDDIDVALSVPRERPLGAPVKLELTLRNAGTRAASLTLGGLQVAFDFTVSTLDGRVVWSRLHGEVVPAILQIRSLAAGETLSFHDEWDQRDNAGRPVPPGSYAVAGSVAGDPAFVADVVPLLITP